MRGKYVINMMKTIFILQFIPCAVECDEVVVVWDAAECYIIFSWDYCSSNETGWLRIYIIWLKERIKPCSTSISLLITLTGSLSGLGVAPWLEGLEIPIYQSIRLMRECFYLTNRGIRKTNPGSQRNKSICDFGRQTSTATVPQNKKKTASLCGDINIKMIMFKLKLNLWILCSTFILL